MTDPFRKMVADYCWQQEQREHATFRHRYQEHQRRELGCAGRYPWRGIMNPTLVGIIEDLEAAGDYDAGKLCEPRANAKTLNVYDQSPYDYEIARRIEAEAAEKKWAGR